MFLVSHLLTGVQILDPVCCRIRRYNQNACLLLQVPLTQSLYVPGKIVEADKMMVDVGTGYYVEKDQQKTTEFLERKVGRPCLPS